ncbi:MAG: efflux RND transporter permease subunit, partial [Planctomycetota bacterium]
RFCLENKLVVGLFVLFIVAWGILVAPFDWKLGGLPRDPVPVDAIPDIGENQQIVFTKWPGRSPEDVEDQVTYPLTVALLGIPGVKTIRSNSMFGFSSIYVIFKEDVEFYWSRTRVLEKLGSLPADTLPSGVQPALGPDATALGQVFWYTLEGRDSRDRPTGGWDLHELRTAQDWIVRYALMSVDGVSEVASIGGFVREYQIDVDPDAMRAYGVALPDIFSAVRMSNVDVGARTIEVSNAEYVVRGLGFIKNLRDLEQTVVKVRDNVPIYIRNIGKVTLGPALRRGALDNAGAEAVGGVVVVRFGDNPLAAIKRVKEKIAQIAPGLPRKTLDDGTISQVTIVPFYDRTGLIYETLGTLNSALSEEILVTIIVVLVMVLHVRSSILISGLLPLAVLGCFIGMKQFGVDANIVALSGIAIAIGTMVDMGIVLCENILRHLDRAGPGESRLEVVFRGASEVGGAVLTAVLTTVVSFLPVFTMEAAEGKLFKPLAYTKTFALVASIIVALVVIPPAAHLLFTAGRRGGGRVKTRVVQGILIAVAGFLAALLGWLALGIGVVVIGAYRALHHLLPEAVQRAITFSTSFILAAIVAIILAQHWMPLGPEKGWRNEVFVFGILGSLLLLIELFRFVYVPVLRWCLGHKVLFLIAPMLILVFGGLAWQGFNTMFPWVPGAFAKIGADPVRVKKWADEHFPGLGKEFMPDLDEGSYLLMPVTMPHASIGEAMDVIRKQDMAIQAIPEVESVVGKIGRVESPLDPAPVSMVETVINYKPEYILDKSGHRMRFRYDHENKEFARDGDGDLIPDAGGIPYRQWRSEIRDADDIWDEIASAAILPGTTTASKLQPIKTRIIMLQTGMRSTFGIKVYGPDLETIEGVGLEMEQLLKQVPSVEPATVVADRIIGKPYLEIDIDRDAIARYGIHIRNVQDVIEVAIGGRRVTTTVEGRERYPVRVRYLRELRDQPETLERILVPAPDGSQIPLAELAEVRYRRGPQSIKSEDTLLVGYVLFDMKPGHAEVDVVEECQRYLNEKIDSGELVIPAGVFYKFAGNYENQVRSEKRLMIVLPLALFIIFLILYFMFRSVATTLLVFSGVFVAWSGGFMMLWLYGQDWFLDFSVFGVGMRDLFQVQTYNLSVAVWVGFLALFGIATDDGVIMATYLKQVFAKETPDSITAIREATVHAGMRRIRPCLMTVGTTILALIPVLTSTGKGADIMVPMAIPSVGGMAVVLITVFVVPTLYCAIEEFKWQRKQRQEESASVVAER